VEVSPSDARLDVSSTIQKKTDGVVPFTLVVNDEFENTMSIWCAEGNGVFSCRSRYRVESGTDVRIQHGEFQLQVVDPGVGFPR
jgi:hypothetical protein